MGRDGVEFAALVEEAAFAIMKEGARNGSRILEQELSNGEGFTDHRTEAQMPGERSSKIWWALGASGISDQAYTDDQR